MTGPAAAAALVRVRALDVEQARSRLGACLAEEAAAEAALRAALDAIAAQGQAAADLLADDVAVEAFGAWLPRGRADRAAAEQALDRANAETARARAALTAARAASEAACGLQARLDAAERARAARAAQHALDDVARSRSGGR